MSKSLLEKFTEAAQLYAVELAKEQGRDLNFIFATLDFIEGPPLTIRVPLPPEAERIAQAKIKEQNECVFAACNSLIEMPAGATFTNREFAAKAGLPNSEWLRGFLSSFVDSGALVRTARGWRKRKPMPKSAALAA